MTPPIQPERGFNTMAAALEEAAESSPVIQQHLDKNKAKILADTRAWLVKLVATDKGISSVLITNALANTTKLEIARRLRERGLVELRKGYGGGTHSTEKLRSMAREGEVTDEWLSAIIWPGTPLQPVGHSETPDDNVYRPKPAPAHTLNHTAKRARIVSDVRDWLVALAEGKKVRVAHVSSQVAGHSAKYRTVSHFREAGFIRMEGSGFESRHVGIFPAIEHIRTMSDEEIAGIIWKRVAPRNDGVVDVTYDSEPGGSSEVLDEGAPPTQQTSSPSDPGIDLIAARMGDLVTIMMRFDARFTRLERELGLPPIEQEMAKTQETKP